MDFKQIQELIKMVNKSNIGEVTVEQKDFRVTIKQKEEQGHTSSYLRQYTLHAAPVSSHHMPATSAGTSIQLLLLKSLNSKQTLHQVILSPSKVR